MSDDPELRVSMERGCLRVARIGEGDLSERLPIASAPLRRRVLAFDSSGEHRPAGEGFLSDLTSDGPTVPRGRSVVGEAVVQCGDNGPRCGVVASRNTSGRL